MARQQGEWRGPGDRPAYPSGQAAGERAFGQGHPVQARADRGAQQQRLGHRRQRQRLRCGLSLGRLTGQRIGGRSEPDGIGPLACVVAVDLPPRERGTGQQAAPGREDPQARPAATHGRVNSRDAGQPGSGQPDPQCPPASRPQRCPAHRLTWPRRQHAFRREAGHGNTGVDGRLRRETPHPARWCPIVGDEAPGERRARRLRRHHETVLGGPDDPGRQRLIQAWPGEQTGAEAGADGDGRRERRRPLHRVVAGQHAPSPPNGCSEIHPSP